MKRGTDPRPGELRKPRPRHGISLVETMIGMIVMSTLMGLSIRWIHQAFEFGADARRNARVQQCASKLVRQFRIDVHSAQSAKLLPDGRLRLRRDSGQAVQYRLTDLGIDRTERSSSDRLARESYRLGRGYRLTLAIPEDSLVTLTIDRMVGDETVPEAQVRAMTGRWLPPGEGDAVE